METPSPAPNDSGADLAEDDEVEILQIKKGQCFSKLGHSRPLFYHFRLFNTVDSK